MREFTRKKVLRVLRKPGFHEDFQALGENYSGRDCHCYRDHFDAGPGTWRDAGDAGRFGDPGVGTALGKADYGEAWGEGKVFSGWQK